MLIVANRRDNCRSGRAEWTDPSPYLAELLPTAAQGMLDAPVEDLAAYERVGFVSQTILRSLEFARCLAVVDRIAAKFAG